MALRPSGWILRSLAAGLILSLGLSGGPQRGLARSDAPQQGPLTPPRGPWVPSWEVLYGGFRQLEDFVATGSDEGWGVDISAFVEGRDTRDQTAFVRWENGVWRSVQIVNDLSLPQLDIAGDTLFAVGNGGAILRLVGQRWEREPSPTGRNLRALDLVSPEEGWAVGDRGTVLRWDGQSWSVSDLPPGFDLVDITTVAGDAPGHAYATAADGRLLVYENGAWRHDGTAPSFDRPVEMVFRAPGEGMLAGRGIFELKDGVWRSAGPDNLNYSSVAYLGDLAYMTVGGNLYYRDGIDWLTADLENGSSYQRVVSTPGGVMALGQRGEIGRIREGQPGEILRPVIDPIEAIDAVSADMAWAGGLALSAGFVGARDGRWDQAQSLPIGGRVIDLDLASDTEGWAVGSLPDSPPIAQVWRWDGSIWKSWPVEKTWELYEVQSLGETEAWAAGRNVVARWDGESWSQVDGSPFDASFAALSMLSGGQEPEGWIGAVDAIYHLKGETWTAEPTIPGYWIPRMVVTAADDGWAIARDLASKAPDRLLRYDGVAWTPFSLPMASDVDFLLDVDSPVPGTAWILVDANGLLHWTGGNWEFHVLSPLGASIEPRRVRVLQLDPEKRDITVWLAGGRPTIARYGVVEPTHVIFVPLAAQDWMRR
jgi:hypothetical protein